MTTYKSTYSQRDLKNKENTPHAFWTKELKSFAENKNYNLVLTFPTSYNV